jgi:hypothetical protein
MNSPPDYIDLILAAYRAGKVKPGTVSEAIVRHDDHCPLLTGAGPCNCSPTVQIVAPEPPEEPKS